jgi:subfamily B ATP-binding cassette protein MsbA
LGDLKASPARKRKARFDARARSTLRRFARDWIWPRHRQIVLAVLITASLAATTGGYPLVIKHAFDSLMKPQGSDLAWI